MDGTIIIAVFLAGLILLVALMVATKKSEVAPVDSGLTPAQRQEISELRKEASKKRGEILAEQRAAQQPVQRPQAVTGLHPSAAKQRGASAQAPQGETFFTETAVTGPDALPVFDAPIGHYQDQQPIGGERLSDRVTEVHGALGRAEELAAQVEGVLPQAPDVVARAQDTVQQAQELNQRRADVQQLIGEAEQLVKQGRALEAIKLMREQSGLSLADAKNVIDRVRRNLGI